MGFHPGPKQVVNSFTSPVVSISLGNVQEGDDTDHEDC
jgi:hypothetical protein